MVDLSAQIVVDISHNPFDNRQVIMTISPDTRYALHFYYGLTLEDVVYNAVLKELSYLYETHIRGEEEKAGDSPEPTHSAERPVYPDTDPSRP